MPTRTKLQGEAGAITPFIPIGIGIHYVLDVVPHPKNRSSIP